MKALKFKERDSINNSYRKNLILTKCSKSYRISNHELLIKTYGKNSFRLNLINDLKSKHSKFKIIWFITFFILGAILFSLNTSKWLNILDLFFVMISIHLISERKIIGIYLGIIECAIYGFICFVNGYYGEFINSCFLYIPLYIFEIISWMISLKKQNKHNNSDEEIKEIRVRKLSKNNYVIYSTIILLITAISFVFLKYIIKQENALVFSALAISVSIIGEFMVAKRYMESYILLYLSQLFGMLIWLQGMLQTGYNIDSIIMITYFLATFTNSIYSYYLWRNVYKKAISGQRNALYKRKIKITKIIKLRNKFKELHWNKQIDMAKNS